MSSPDDAAAELLTLQQVADLLGVHYMTAYRYVRLGLLPATKVGAAWQVARADAEQLRDPAPDGGDDGSGPGAPHGTAAGTGGGTATTGRRAARGRGRLRAAPWEQRLEHRLRAGDDVGAWGVVEAAMASGATPESVYLDVIGPAMVAIGDAWEAGEIDVAVEHRASVIAMRMVGRLGPRFSRRGRSRGTVVVGAVAGELHGLPVALLADVLRGRGWSVDDLGADVPLDSLVAAVVRAERLVAVGISATAVEAAPTVAATVEAVRAARPGVRVLVGGGAVSGEAHAVSLGADGWAPDGRAAAALLDGWPAA